MKELLTYYIISGILTAVYLNFHHNDLTAYVKVIVNEEMAPLFTKRVFSVAGFLLGAIALPFIVISGIINFIIYIVKGK